jgi:hypothetical protein
VRTAALALALVLAVGAGGAWAGTQYLDDGAIPNGLGGWDLPDKGACAPDATKATRAECEALRLTTVQADCVAPASWTTGSVCNDTETDPTSCEAQAGRLWNPATNLCSVTMKGKDRNDVTCLLLGGRWAAGTPGTCRGSWVMPARDSYEPDLLSGTGPGDLCLRCHRSDTEWNGPRVRDVEGFIQHGHKNIVKKVMPPLPQSGAGSITPYPADEAGNAFDWLNGTVTVGGNARDLVWLINNWMAPLGRSFYEGPPSAAQVCSDPRYTTGTCVANGGTLVLNAGLSYSCARCHTTGWTSDATLQNTPGIEGKEPEQSYPGITWTREADATFGVISLSGGISGDPNKLASWDLFGVTCARCHGSAVDTLNVVAGSVPPEYNAPAGMSRHHNSLTGATGNQCTDIRFTAQTQCEAAGATWIPASGTASCSVPGICSTLDPADNTSALCTAHAGAQWVAANDIVRCLDIHEYGKENDIPAYAAAKFTGTAANRGQIITRLCMDCHRADTAGIPNEPNTILAGNSHGVLGFVGHAIGQEYLNSPHAKFTGSFSQIASGKFKYDGTGEYQSHFMGHAEAANTGNGCTGCHDVHKSFVADANPAGGWLREECTECHAKTEGAILHPTGAGTPFEHGLEESCMSCHMPNGLHLWRINVDQAYATFPPNAVNANAPANTAAEGTYTNAVWVDVDLACGKCHGGGTNQATTTIASNAGAVLTVASTAGFYPAAKIEIPGAGALQADGIAREDFYGTVKSVDAVNSRITLLGAATLANVGGKGITQNPTVPEAGYMTKAQLAALAVGMHSDAPVPRFFYNQVANTLQVNFSANNSTCSGALANCDAFAWDFGDGSTGAGATISHVFPAAGPRTVTLTVSEYGVGEASKTRTITVVEPNPPPTEGGTFAFDANTWTATVNDASTDAGGIKRVTVNWGDGTMVSTDTTAPFGPFTHTFLNPAPAVPGYFKVTKTVYDSIGQQVKVTYQANPAYFSIAGTVFRSNGTTPVATAKVEVKKGGALVKTVYSAANGTFSAGFLKPGTYTLTVTKPNFTFADPAATIVVGPTSLGNFVNATNP